jgi:hypothetical protein
LLAIYSQIEKLQVLKSNAFGDFQEPKFDQILRKITRFLCMVQVGSQKYRKMFKFFYFHIHSL